MLYFFFFFLPWVLSATRMHTSVLGKLAEAQTRLSLLVLTGWSVRHFYSQHHCWVNPQDG